MFNMAKIGSKIANLRKENNLTQMELADKLGISYQAVSNWERGETMPDISKLPELADLFSVSIDEILCNEKGTKVIKSIIDETNEYLKDNSVSIEEFSNLGPVLKSEQNDEIIKNIINSSSAIDIPLLEDILPFINVETSDLVVNFVIKRNLEFHLERALPFVSSEAADKLVEYKMKKEGFKQFPEVLPFVSKSTADNVVNYCIDNNVKFSLKEVMPFISQECADKAVNHIMNEEGFDKFPEVLPFVSQDMAGEIVKYCIKNNIKFNLRGILPFVSEDILNSIIMPTLKMLV